MFYDNGLYKEQLLRVAKVLLIPFIHSLMCATLLLSSLAMELESLLLSGAVDPTCA